MHLGRNFVQMAKQPTLTDVGSGFLSATTINNNNTNIETAFDNTLSRDGSSPNQMNADIDMNSNDLLNVKDIKTQTLYIGGTAVTTTALAEDQLATFSVESKSDLEALSVPSTRTTLLLMGHNNYGDGGHAIYKRVDSEPSHAAKIRSTDRYLSGGTEDTTNGGWWELVPEAAGVAVECFGVTEAASAACKTAWENAGAYAVSEGIVILGTPGKTYAFDPYAYGRVEIVPREGKSLYMDFRYATLKFADNMVYANNAFEHMIYIVMATFAGTTNETAERVEIKNFTADGNLRNQSDTAFGTVTTEQQAAIKVQCINGNRIKWCVVENWRQVDPIADSLLIGPSSAEDFDLDGDGISETSTISNVVINNCHAGVRTSVRAFIALGSGCGNVMISNITRDVATTAETNSIETEFSSQGEQRVRCKLINVDIDDIELGGVAGKEHQFDFEMVNVRTHGFFIPVYCNIRAVSCHLRVSLSNTWRTRTAEYINTTFEHVTYNSSGTNYDPQSISFTFPTSGQFLHREVGCIHTITGIALSGATKPLIETPVIADSRYGNHILEFYGVEFPTNAPISIDTYQGGIARTYGCRIGGTTYGVQTGCSSNGSGGWESYGDDMLAVTGATLSVIGAVTGAKSRVHLDGGKWGTLAFTSTGSFYKELLTYSTRHRQVSATPTGGGIVGDEVQLDSASYGSAASAAPIKWLCVETETSAATWLATANKP